MSSLVLLGTMLRALFAPLVFLLSRSPTRLNHLSYLTFDRPCIHLKVSIRSKYSLLFFNVNNHTLTGRFLWYHLGKESYVGLPHPQPGKIRWLQSDGGAASLQRKAMRQMDTSRDILRGIKVEIQHFYKWITKRVF